MQPVEVPCEGHSYPLVELREHSILAIHVEVPRVFELSNLACVRPLRDKAKFSDALLINVVLGRFQAEVQQGGLMFSALRLAC